jgi:HAMP domain-containing protein
MRNRVLTFVIVLSLGCAFLGLLLSNSEPNGSRTLADLVSGERWGPGPNGGVREVAQWVRERGLRLANLDVDLIFYAVLAVCGILLALRAVVAAVRIARLERLSRSSESYRENSNSARLITRPADEVAPPRLDAPSDLVGGFTEKSHSATRRSDSARLLPTKVRSRLAPFAHGLAGKMIFVFTGIVATFGLLTAVLVYFTLTSALKRQSIQRARVTAVNVRDSAPAYMFKKNAAELRKLLDKYVSKPGIAYVLVEDGRNHILAHGFAVPPQELLRVTSPGSSQQESQRTLSVGDGNVYEVSVPVLEGQIGAVRVGLWKDEVDAEISKAVIPILKLVVLVVIVGIFLTILLVWRIIRPISRLVATARRISEGELDVPSSGVNDASEFGELSRSFERMRSSVRAAIVRLNEEK